MINIRNIYLLGATIFFMPTVINAQPSYFGLDRASTVYKFTSVNGPFSASENGYRIYAGIPFDEHFAVESAWIGQGEASSDYTSFGGGVETISLSGLQFSAVIKLAPTEDGSGIYGRIGAYMWNLDYTDHWLATGESISASEDDWNKFYGFGADVFVSKNLALRAEYNYVSVDVSKEGSVDAKNYSIGILYRLK